MQPHKTVMFLTGIGRVRYIRHRNGTCVENCAAIQLPPNSGYLLVGELKKLTIDLLYVALVIDFVDPVAAEWAVFRLAVDGVSIPAEVKPHVAV